MYLHETIKEITSDSLKEFEYRCNKFTLWILCVKLNYQGGVSIAVDEYEVNGNLIRENIDIRDILDIYNDGWKYTSK